MSGYSTIELAQCWINTTRVRHTPTPLDTIPMSGSVDTKTRKAIRCFQHEYNLLCGERLLDEVGALDDVTIEALQWSVSALDQQEAGFDLLKEPKSDS